ncbi:FkbM family methyltransferase [Halopseudomonas aestusnigri]|uniref:FkbM family methyltransferase n=1 Tax=Halopseudomonas aestusnigri TaxID=857252 RepID=UPI0025526D4A|nr:FkbM family methyltransferase [Halopseudomonas aestusnigri]MDL2198443.1 FkbM family methyltransferase [Halopseudomonas aestusnigri]
MNHPLHRRQKLKSLMRWMSLTLSSYLTPTRQIAIPYVGGAILNWPRESTSVMICARYGLGEYADMAFLLHLLREKDLFCDVGANAGVYTVLAGKSVGCDVVSIEPVPDAYNLLMQNVYANGIAHKVDSKNLGAGGEFEILNFTSTMWSYNHVVEEVGDNTVSVESYPIDEILDGRVPLAIKIDVEGFEGKVILGACKTLADPSLQAVVIEVWHGHLARYGDTVDQLMNAFYAAGFSGPYWYDPERRELIDPGCQERRKFNQIFVRDMGVVLERLKSARRYEVHGTSV